MINDSENGIFPSYLWQTGDQIHGDLLERERVFWGSDSVKGDSRSMCQVFVLLARCTTGDIVGDPGLHSLPDQLVLGLSDGLIPSRVSCSGVIVDQSHQVPFLRFGGRRYGYLSNELCWRENSHFLVFPLASVNI